MNDLTDLKAALRKQSFARRREAHAADLAADRESSRAAMDHFLAARLHTGAEVISGYRPIRTEIDPTPLMEALHAAGHRLCVPVIKGRGLALAFREWHPEAEMTEGAFGALIPWLHMADDGEDKDQEETPGARLSIAPFPVAGGGVGLTVGLR